MSTDYDRTAGIYSRVSSLQDLPNWACEAERQLDDCFDKAFSNTERNMCKSKFGGAKTPFGF